MSELEKIYTRYPRLGWNIDDLLINPNISSEFMQRKGFETDLYSLSSSKNLTTKFVEEQFEIEYDDVWNWEELSINPNIDMDFIQKWSSKPWVNLLSNPNIHLSFIKKNFSTFLETQSLESILIKVCELPHITPSQILNDDFFSFKIKLEYFSGNPNVTTQFVQSEERSVWNWEKLSKNMSVSSILNNPQKPWNFDGLSLNPNISWSDVMSINKSFRRVGKRVAWNYANLSLSPNIDVGDIAKNSFLPWDKMNILKNPNLTFEFFRDHIDKPDYIVWKDNYSLTTLNLSSNLFKYHPDFFTAPYKKKIKDDILKEIREPVVDVINEKVNMNDISNLISEYLNLNFPPYPNNIIKEVINRYNEYERSDDESDYERSDYESSDYDESDDEYNEKFEKEESRYSLHSQGL